MKKHIGILLGISVLMAFGVIYLGTTALGKIAEGKLITMLVKNDNSTSSGGKTQMTTRNMRLSQVVTVITNSTSADVIYSTGTPGVKITGPENKLETLDISEYGNTVKITSRKNDRGFIHDMGKVKIYITLPSLLEININGAGNFTAKNVTTVTLRVNQLGSGDVNINDISATNVRFLSRGSGDFKSDKVEASSVEIFSQGSGDMVLKELNASAVNTTLQGSGDLTLGKLAAIRMNLTIQGSGDARLSNTSTSVVKIMDQGSGDVTISGETTVADVAVYGSGDVNCRNLKYTKINKQTLGSGEIYY